MRNQDHRTSQDLEWRQGTHVFILHPAVTMLYQNTVWFQTMLQTDYLLIFMEQTYCVMYSMMDRIRLCMMISTRCMAV